MGTPEALTTTTKYTERTPFRFLGQNITLNWYDAAEMWAEMKPDSYTAERLMQLMVGTYGRGPLPRA